MAAPPLELSLEEPGTRTWTHCALSRRRLRGVPEHAREYRQAGAQAARRSSARVPHLLAAEELGGEAGVPCHAQRVCAPLPECAL